MRQGQRVLAWVHMRKGIADIRRRVEVSRAANQRYLEALSVVGLTVPSSFRFHTLLRLSLNSNRSLRCAGNG